MTAPITIKDVAQRAGVSAKTVSRVINGEQHVRDAVREHVLRVVADMDYRPNLFARGLSSSRSFLLGLFFDDPVSAYAADVQLGALQRCRAFSHHLVIEQLLRDTPDWLATLSGTLRELRLEGAILTPPVCDWADAVAVFEHHGVPVVRISPGTTPQRTPEVRIDDHAAARAITRALIDDGHRDIGFIGGNPDHSASLRRRSGFVEALTEAGIVGRPERMLGGDFTFRSGLEAAERLLADGDRPTAVFASNDEMAFAVVTVAMRHGIGVPDELSVAGFDDLPLARMSWPQLTTIRQPNAAMAAEAVNLLLRARGDQPGDASVQLPFTLVKRGSSGPAPAAS